MPDMLSNTIQHFVNSSNRKIQDPDKTYKLIHSTIVATFPAIHPDRKYVEYILYHEFHRVIELIVVGQNPAAYLEMNNAMTNLMNRLKLNGKSLEYTYGKRHPISLKDLSKTYYKEEVISDMDYEHLQFLFLLNAAIVRKDTDQLYDMLGAYTDDGIWIDSIQYCTTNLLANLINAIIIAVKLVRSNPNADPLYDILLHEGETLISPPIYDCTH